MATDLALVAHPEAPPGVREQLRIVRCGGVVAAAWRPEPDADGFREPDVTWLADREVCLEVPDIGQFVLDPASIEYRQAPGVSSEVLEICLLGQILASWFELRGCVALHAAGVELSGRTIALVGRNGAGKTGLAAMLMRRGARLVSDDLLVIEGSDRCGWSVRPSFPFMRMWPDEAEAFFGTGYRFPRVRREAEKLVVRVGPGGFGEFATRPRILGAIVLPDRSGLASLDELALEPLAPAARVRVMLQHGFVGRTAEWLGLRSRRLGRLSAMAASIPVFRLRYPSGFDRLEAVVDALQAELIRARIVGAGDPPRR